MWVFLNAICWCCDVIICQLPLSAFILNSGKENIAEAAQSVYTVKHALLGDNDRQTVNP